MTKLTIVGAGLTGPLLAIYLAKRGYEVEIFERFPDPRKVTLTSGRSISLAISTRGIYALEKIGISEPALRHAMPMVGRMLHSINGDQTYQPYGQNEHEFINAISRAQLNLDLIKVAADYPNIRFRFQQQFKGVDVEKSILEIHDLISNQVNRVEFDYLFATDGSSSAVRSSLEKSGHVNFKVMPLEHGYKELSIPRESSKALKDFDLIPSFS